MAFSPYHRNQPSLRALALMYMAKRKAESSPGVGPTTDVHIITDLIAVRIEEPSLNKVRQHVLEMEVDIKKVYDDKLSKIAEDPELAAPDN
jgi:hypothetical protein